MQEKHLHSLQQTLNTALGLKVFQSLAGTWQFSREIQNHLTPECSGVVHGSADFVAINSLQYAFNENGVFSTQSHTIHSQNAFIYIYNPNKKSISVYSAQEQSITNLLFELYFTDARHNKLTSQALHQCNLDAYTAEFNFLYEHGICSLQIIYTVVGPNKNYTSKTIYHQLQS